MARRTLVALIAVVASAAIVASAPAATASTPSGVTLEGLTVQDGRLMALLTVSGVSTIQPAQVTQQQAGCSLVTLSIGPFDVNVASTIVIHVDPIAVDVRLEGLLGSLVCGLLGGGAPALPAPA